MPSDKSASDTEGECAFADRDLPDDYVRCDDCGHWRHGSRETCLNCNVYNANDGTSDESEPTTVDDHEDDGEESETTQTKLVTDGGQPTGGIYQVTGYPNNNNSLCEDDVGRGTPPRFSPFLASSFESTHRHGTEHDGGADDDE